MNNLEHLPENPYPQSIFPLSIDDIDEVLGKGQVPKEKRDAIFGAWGRYVYAMAQRDMLEAGFVWEPHYTP